MNLPGFSFTVDTLLQGIWRATWQASVLAIIVLAIQSILSRRIGGRGRYLLWSVVILRLLLPVLPQSSFSIFNLSKLSVPQQSPQVIPVIAGTLEAPSVAPVIPSSIPEIVRTTSASELPATWNLPGIVLSLWLLGIAVILARMMAVSIGWRRSLGELHPMTDPQSLKIAESAMCDLSIRRGPRILVGQDIRTPAVVGVFRPTLLLPARVLEHCSAAQIRLIVLHELAHVKRHDIAANWLLAAASILHWFNPFVWLIASRIRADRELACDETVLALSHESDPQAYGQTLLRLIEILSPRASERQPQLVGILEPSGPLQRRMRMIAQYRHQGSARWVWLSLVLLALGCTSLTDSVRGQERTVTQAPPRPATQPAARPTDPEKVDIQTQLQRVLPEARFDNIAFVEVIEFLRDVSGVNIVVNWRAMEAAGIDRATPVTIRLRDVPFEQLLRQILRDVGGGAVQLHSSVEGQVLTITTQEEAAADARAVLYDVTDLLVNSAGAPLGGAEFNQRMDELTDLIRWTVAWDSWRDLGGSSGVGSLRKFNNKLIITQTPSNHKQIEYLLARLRESPTTQPRPLAGPSL